VAGTLGRNPQSEKSQIVRTDHWAPTIRSSVGSRSRWYPLGHPVIHVVFAILARHVPNEPTAPQSASAKENVAPDVMSFGRMVAEFRLAETSD